MSKPAALWKPVVEQYADDMRPLLVPGALVSDVRLSERNGVACAQASPFAETGYCVCGGQVLIMAQFWHNLRLWRILHCAEHNCEVVHVESAASCDTMPEGCEVTGNSDWTWTPLAFLPTSGTHAWDHSPIMVELGSYSGDDIHDIQQVLARELDAFVSDAYPVGCPSRVGGHADFIQWDHEPRCATCMSAMPLLCQLGQAAGFYWADGGQLYVFACADHPEQTAVFRDTH